MFDLFDFFALYAFIYLSTYLSIVILFIIYTICSYIITACMIDVNDL